ncbi:MAG: arsenate reductase (glutaredoxin) [Pelagibacterales bacterium]|nr:arsenate reductase (glutaredoxin) [Pelagibacterales bacterium]OUV26932.1 MAG: arsenate reductase (glutaredoxin) [Alphaproteobacteria bacterium TMED109]RCL83910.1 MAG: arsenate reductase (glutaredoxin) [Alphaproteobacteria bacterium]|tara:strand:- start:829 stop:1164 length:336 start_codon:yes stop_codon:yes gene_type:complete
MQIFHNPRCSKSRETLNIIIENNIKHNINLYLENPLSVEEIRIIIKKLDTTANNIIRKNEDIYKKLNLKDADEETLIKKISENPILLERPIVVKGNKAIIGRPPENVKILF